MDNRKGYVATATRDLEERPIEHQDYYKVGGVECIQIARHFDFNLGNALKYIFRAGRKKESGMSDTDKQIEDLKKAQVYIWDEIKMLEGWE